MVLVISGASGPELPMQVVHPKATRLKPSLSRSSCSPDLSRYSETTCDPGASEVLTHGLVVSLLETALRASRPAPIMTLGLDVLVQEVIAAITTSPCPRSCERPSTGSRLPSSLPLPNSLSSDEAKPCLVSLSAMRSCGRFGPASDGSTCDSSSLSTSVKIGSGVVLVR